MRPTALATFVDTNVPIYAGGRPHRLREPCSAVLDLLGDHPDAFITDAEVLQEILHVYLARREWPAGQVVLQGFVELMTGRIEPIFASDAEAAAILAGSYSNLSARDLIHLAVMNRLGVTRIITADTGFDRLRGIQRLDPTRLQEWRERVLTT